MSIKYKLLISFTSLTLISLIVAGLFSYQKAKQELITENMNRLHVVADVQVKRINEGLSYYLDDVNLISGRSLLRLKLAEYEKNHSPATLAEIKKPIVEAKTATPAIDIISIRDQNGKIVVSTDNTAIINDKPSADTTPLLNAELSKIFKDQENSLKLKISGPIFFNNKNIGTVEMIMSADPLISVTEDYTGLGKTGEVEIARKNEVGDALYLTPLRFNAGAALSQVTPKEETNNVMTQAIAEKEEEFRGGNVVDYRGISVFAVSRFIATPQWGLVVKIDQAEALGPANSLLKTFSIIIAISLLFSIILIYFLSKAITNPILELTIAASKLEGGDFTVTANSVSKDEIGKLGKTFNNMVSKIKESYATLEQKVNERTNELTKKNEELEQMNQKMIGRELKMIQLKSEIEELKNK